MEVSTFELLFKPQAPLAPIGVTEPVINGQVRVDVVVQGYFLTIANLEDKEYKFKLEFISSPPSSSNAITQNLRSLTGNTLVFIDSGGSDNLAGTLKGTLSPKVFTLENEFLDLQSNTTIKTNGLITIPPQGTALVAIVPSAFKVPFLDPTPITDAKFEVRGYVRLTLPALRPVAPPSGPVASAASAASFFPFKYPQSDKPVRVLLTPEHKATFLEITGKDAMGKDTSTVVNQTQHCLPNASGQALNLIEPEKGGFFFNLEDLLNQGKFSKALEIMQENSEMIEPEMLAAFLSQLDPEKADLSKFNKLLSEADIPFAVERRKSKKS